MKKFLNFGTVTQVAARDIVAEDLVTVLAQARFVGFLVDPVDCRPAQLHQVRRDRLIRQQHEFLNELM